jgi:hypothetical protein
MTVMTVFVIQAKPSVALELKPVGLTGRGQAALV